MRKDQINTFITSFLVLALLASSASLAFTTIRKPHKDRVVEQPTAQGQSIPEIGESALVEQLPSSVAIAGYDLAAEFSPKVDTRDNFTDVFAKTLAYELVSNNPGGPSETTGIAPPGDITAVVNEYIDETTLTPTTYTVDSSRLNVTESYTAEDVTNYLGQVDQIFASADSKHSIGGLVERYQGNDPEPGAIEASNFIFSEAQDRLYKTKTPEPLLAVHEAVLRYLELNKQLSDVDYTTDPLKAVVFATKFPTLRDQEVANINKAVAELETTLPEVYAQSYEPFFFLSLVGVQRAHAQWVVKDFLNLAKNIANGIGIHGNWGQNLLEWTRKVATQILKNQIVKKMIQQTIRWVQGGGKPQFITNWRKFLQDGVSQEVGRVLSEIEPRLCSNFRSFTSNYLQRGLGVNYNDPLDRVNCTLDQIISNISSFYTDFRNGGWAALGGAIQPQNNVWGAILIGNEAIFREATAESQSASADAQANQSFLGSKRCVSYDVVEGVSKDIIQAYPGFVGLAQPRGCYTDATRRFDGRPNGEVCDIKVCRSNGYQSTTPGGQVAGQLEKALGASLDNIVNAEDLAGLAGVLVDAAVSRLTKIGTGGILGLFGDGDSGGDGGNLDIGDGTEPTTPQEQADLDAQKSQALRLIDGYTNRINQTKELVSELNTLVVATDTLLDSVVLTCPARLSEAQDRIAAIERLIGALAAESGDISELETVITNLKARVDAATSILVVSEIITDLNQYNGEIAQLSTRAANRNAQLQDIRLAAEENLEGQSCSTPLPQLDV